MLGNFIEGFSLGLKSLGYVRLSSPAFKNRGVLPDKYTCLGEGISPPLSVENFNPEVKAFALTFCDSKRYYWVVYFMSKDLSCIPENAKESNRLRFGINDFGIKGYTPPCSSERELFKFTLFALSEIPQLESVPTGKELNEAVKDITLYRSHLFCYVGR